MNEAIILRTINLYERGLDWKNYLYMFCRDDEQFNKIFGGVNNGPKS
jgi:hypothetical protein